jgi:hypothetical protein
MRRLSKTKLSPLVSEEHVHFQATQIAKLNAESSLSKDHTLGLYDLLERRPTDRRLAQILCDWMNMHQKGGDESWKICSCLLCSETKQKMNELGDPIIHTTRGWECVGGNREFETRDIAKEFTDNTPKLTGGTVDTCLDE